MPSYKELFENNKRWIQEKTNSNKDFFQQLAKDQTPEYLYIGCNDSKVTAEELMGLGQSEDFVHRNIANLINNTDLIEMSVINYAIRHLGVKHIIVCCHY